MQQVLTSWLASSSPSQFITFTLRACIRQWLLHVSLNDWDTSNVTSMHATFMGNTTFNGDITDWDTGNVTTMEHLFRGTNAFNQDIGNWDVS